MFIGLWNLMGEIFSRKKHVIKEKKFAISDKELDELLTVPILSRLKKN